MVADRVPEQLVVVGEPVHRSLDPIDDLVGMAAGDRGVGVPDPDREVAVFVLGLHVGGGASGRSHGHEVDRVDAVELVVVAEPVRDEPEDPVPRGVAELLHDGLGDQQVSRVLDHDVHVEARGRLERGSLRPGRRGHEDRPDHDAEPRDAGRSPHSASTKKNEMAMMAYAPVSWAPSSQLLRPSVEIMKTRTVDNATAATSNVLKMKSIGWPTSRLMKTSAGATKSAIWVDEPIAISRVTSTLSRRANMIADECSAALPMIGITIRPTKSSDSPRSAKAGSSEPTRNSASSATTAAAASSTPTAVPFDHSACSSGEGVRNRCSWVISVKIRAAAYSAIRTAATVALTTSR